MTISKTFNDSYQQVIDALRLNRQATGEHAAALAAAHKKFNETEAALNVQFEKETREATLAQDNGNREIQRQMGQVETSIRRGENDFKIAHVDGRNLPSATVKVDGSKGEERAFADAVENVGRIATALEDTRRRLERVRGEIEIKKARRRTFFRILVGIIIVVVAGVGLWGYDQISQQQINETRIEALAYLETLPLRDAPRDCDVQTCSQLGQSLAPDRLYAYYFSVRANQSVSISLTQASGNPIAGYIELRDSQGNIIETRNGTSDLPTLSLTNQFTEAGVYLVFIKSLNNTSGSMFLTISKGQ